MSYSPSVYGKLESVAANQRVVHFSREVGNEFAGKTGRDVGLVDVVGKAVVSESTHVDRCVITGIGRRTVELLVVEELGIKTFSFVDVRQVVGCKVAVHQFAGLVVNDFCAGDSFSDGVYDRDCVLRRWKTVVVAVVHGSVVGIGSDNGNGFDVFGQWKYSVIFQQYHGFPGSFQGECGIFRAAQGAFIQVFPGEPVFRIEHAQFNARAEYACKGHIKVGFVDKPFVKTFNEGCIARTAFQVGSGQDRCSTCCCRIGMGFVLPFCVKIVYRTAVRQYQ